MMVVPPPPPPPWRTPSSATQPDPSPASGPELEPEPRQRTPRHWRGGQAHRSTRGVRCAIFDLWSLLHNGGLPIGIGEFRRNLHNWVCEAQNQSAREQAVPSRGPLDMDAPDVVDTRTLDSVENAMDEYAEQHPSQRILTGTIAEQQPLSSTQMSALYGIGFSLLSGSSGSNLLARAAVARPVHSTQTASSSTSLPSASSGKNSQDPQGDVASHVVHALNPTRGPHATAVCTICMEDENSDASQGPLTLLECGHKFHEQCLCQWEEIRGRPATCPQCREVLQRI